MRRRENASKRIRRRRVRGNSPVSRSDIAASGSSKMRRSLARCLAPHDAESALFVCGACTRERQPVDLRPMAKEPKRCTWSLSGNELYIRYHDTEWGVPAWDDRTQFEFLILEGAQAGLSWSTILNKREGYRRAFAGFDPVKVARFTPARIEKILLDPRIVRNRSRVECTVSNARMFLKLVDELGSFDDYIWSFVGGKPIVNRWK